MKKKIVRIVLIMATIFTCNLVRSNNKISAKESDIAQETINYPVSIQYEEITSLPAVKENFGLAGTASWYNSWAWLTPNNAKANVGSLYLKNKIQLDTDFTIEGKLAITLKSAGSNGDGIGIGFHTGAVDQIGGSGGGLGITGLPNALSFVLDTYQNKGEPVAPYFGIWTTNEKGIVTVNQTYASAIPASGYQEVSYSFSYDSSQRVITFQVFVNGKPVFNTNGISGYQLPVPSTNNEYAFVITGATGGNYNNQYASVSSAKVPILVTNRPKVTFEEVNNSNIKLTLTDENNINYPENSIINVNSKSYIVDSSSSISIPSADLSDLTAPLTISASSYKEKDGKISKAKVSETIQYKLNDISLEITSVASDDINSESSTTITGITDPNAYIRITDTPVLETIEPTITSTDNIIISPVPNNTNHEFSDNFTIQANELGEFSYKVIDDKHFTAGSTLKIYSFLAGKNITKTQIVLDKTPPKGESVDYQVGLNDPTPPPNQFVKNPTDTNPLPQNFSYTFNAETPQSVVDNYMSQVGEHLIKVDLSDDAGNKTTITSKLIVNEVSETIIGDDFEVSYADIRNLTEEQLKQYILTHSEPSAYKLENGTKVDLSSFITVTDFGGLNDTEELQAKSYLITLTVKSSDSGLTNDLSTTIKVTVIDVEALLKVEFVNEANQILSEYTTTLNTQVGNTIDLTQNISIINQLTSIEKAGYDIVKRPINENEVKINSTLVTVQYNIQGILSLTSVPSTFNFGTLTYDATTKRLENPSLDEQLIVTDTRADATNGWRLTASLSTPMQNTDGRELIDALRYVNQGKETVLNEAEQIIYANTKGTTGSYTVSNDWGTTANTDGIKLQINSSDMVYTGEYVGVITWKVMAGQP